MEKQNRQPKRSTEAHLELVNGVFKTVGLRNLGSVSDQSQTHVTCALLSISESWILSLTKPAWGGKGGREKIRELKYEGYIEIIGSGHDLIHLVM